MIERVRAIVVIAGALTLAGCAGWEPLDYTPASELKPGPGLFTGDAGAFVIERRFSTPRSEQAQTGGQ